MVSPECRKKSGRCLRIVAKVNMPPSSGLMPQPCPATSPPQTKLTSRRSAGAVRKRPTTGSLAMSVCDEVAEADAIEDVLSGGQVFQQHLGGEVALRQRRDRRQRAGMPEGLGGGDLDQHLRRPVGARPHHAAVGADVAGLHAMGDQRPVGGAAEIGHRDGADAGRRWRWTGNGGGKFCAVDVLMHASFVIPGRNDRTDEICSRESADGVTARKAL